MTVKHKMKAWEAVKEITGTGFEKNAEKTENAGYRIYDASDNSGAWVSDLETRLELNLADGKTINIWIVKDETEQTKKAEDHARKQDAEIIIDLIRAKIAVLNIALNYDDTNKYIKQKMTEASGMLQCLKHIAAEDRMYCVNAPFVSGDKFEFGFYDSVGRWFEIEGGAE